MQDCEANGTCAIRIWVWACDEKCYTTECVHKSLCTWHLMLPFVTTPVISYPTGIWSEIGFNSERICKFIETHTNSINMNIGVGGGMGGAPKVFSLCHIHSIFPVLQINYIKNCGPPNQRVFPTSLSMKSSISAYPCINSAQSTGLDLHHDIVLWYFREDDLWVKEGW